MNRRVIAVAQKELEASGATNSRVLRPGLRILPLACLLLLAACGGHSPSQALYRDENDLGDPGYDIYKPDAFSWLLEHHTG
jgi:hypothetical protein